MNSARIFSGTASRASKASGQKNNIISGCSAVGSALALGARCRVFESPHSDQKEKSAPGAGFLRGKRGGAGRRSGGGCSEAEHTPRLEKPSRRGARWFFRAPQAGRAKQAGRKVNNCARIVGAKLNISGCSAVGSACTLGCEAERRRRRMQRGGARAAVEKIEQVNSARIFSGTASRASKASGQKNNIISGCSAVGSALALGASWRYPE